MSLIYLFVVVVVLLACIYWAPQLAIPAALIGPNANAFMSWALRAVFVILLIVVLLDFIGYGPGLSPFHYRGRL